MVETVTHPLSETGGSKRFVEPCILVIFGATGDLTARKLLPAIYNLAREGQLSPQFACVGFARRDKTHEQFREEMKQAINSFSVSNPSMKRCGKIFQSTFIIIALNSMKMKDINGFRLF